MDPLENLLTPLLPGLPMVIALVLGILALIGLRKLMESRYEGQADKNMKMQLVMLVLSFALLIIVIILSPIGDSSKGQVLSLIGIVLSAAIALSSTTFIGNAMAGMMIRTIRNFKVGDYLSVDECYGRVTERGLFHVEIQTEQRDLVTLPNLKLVTSSVKVVRTDGTIISAELSLGYDIPRQRIKELLLKAAERCELSDPFVHVVELGDFSVTYRISGLLIDTKQLISARSRIREKALDELHAAGIEIVSPTFMNQRQFDPRSKFIPASIHDDENEALESKPEDIVFDKAAEAETTEQLRARYEAMGVEIKALKEEKSKATFDNDRAAIEQKIERIERSRAALETRLKDLDSKNGKNGS